MREHASTNCLQSMTSNEHRLTRPLQILRRFLWTVFCPMLGSVITFKANHITSIVGLTTLAQSVLHQSLASEKTVFAESTKEASAGLPVELPS